MGANRGSQRAQTRPGPPRRLRNVTAGERLPVRLPQIRPDTGFVAGVKGSPVQIRPSRLVEGQFLEALGGSSYARLRSSGFR